VERLGLCDGLGLVERLGLCDGLGLVDRLGLFDRLGLVDDVLCDRSELVNLVAPIADAEPEPHGDSCGLIGAARAGAIVKLERRKNPATAWTATQIARTIPTGTASLRWLTRPEPVPWSRPNHYP